MSTLWQNDKSNCLNIILYRFFNLCPSKFISSEKLWFKGFDLSFCHRFVIFSNRILFYNLPCYLYEINYSTISVSVSVRRFAPRTSFTLHSIPQFPHYSKMNYSSSIFPLYILLVILFVFLFLLSSNFILFFFSNWFTIFGKSSSIFSLGSRVCSRYPFHWTS